MNVSCAERKLKKKNKKLNTLCPTERWNSLLTWETFQFVEEHSIPPLSVSTLGVDMSSNCFIMFLRSTALTWVRGAAATTRDICLCNEQAAEGLLSHSLWRNVARIKEHMLHRKATLRNKYIFNAFSPGSHLFRGRVTSSSELTSGFNSSMTGTNAGYWPATSTFLRYTVRQATLRLETFSPVQMESLVNINSSSNRRAEQRGKRSTLGHSARVWPQTPRDTTVFFVVSDI